ncbi:MAG: hydroxyacylglutathione hydrolase [Cellvibrionaceae bacterium]
MTNPTKELNVIQVPAFNDNYLWILHLKDDKQAYVVDPGDAKPIRDALSRNGLTLAGILVTHHHPDHTAGIGELIKEFGHKNVPVYGPDGGSVPSVTHPLHDGDVLNLQNGLTLKVFEVPGHTLDHIAYFYDPQSQHLPSSPDISTKSLGNHNKGKPALFGGDTLFAAGCGRLFEGTPAQMHHSLSKYMAFPDETLVYCAHEYTLANLAFASAVEPKNQELLERVTRETAKREQNLSTIPTNIGLEKATNPFLRCHIPSVVQSAESYAGNTLTSEEEIFGAIRQWKDNF